MARLLVVAACVISPAAAALDGKSAATPVQKVVQLLEGIVSKGKEEKKAEEIQFSTYKQFCEDTSGHKSTAISKANERIEVLNADIQKAAADADRLGKEIAGHEEDIAVWTGDSEAATKVRAFEQADYDATHQDYTESIDALAAAQEVLKKQPTKLAQSALVQLSALQVRALVPQEAKRAIAAFLSQPLGVVAPPEAHGYEGHTQGIQETLEELSDKFVEERTALEKAEAESKHSYELLSQDLRAQIDGATKDRDSKAAQKAQKLQAKANAAGLLQDTTSTRDADVTYLTDLTATCELKATDFESRQSLRVEEIEAVQKAVQILSGASVSGAAEKHLPSLVQVKKTALAHLRSDQSSATRTLLGAFLEGRAEQLNSRVLSVLAARVASDPFQKVKKMIQDLLTRLAQEANEEAEHKGWCDTELATNEKTRIAKTDAVETLHAEIDLLQTSVAKLTVDIASLQQAVAALDAAMSEATQLRQAEKARNTETIADAQAAQTAVAQALAVLQEFYAKAGEATALLQGQQQPEAPEIFDSPYKGLQAENGGVISLIEVIQSDFARLESETKGAEAAAQKEYDTFITDSKVDRATKTSDIEHATAKKQDQSQALVEREADLEGTQRELTAAVAYFDKLKPSCVDAGVSYEDRVARREAELESLQQALRILNGE